VRTWGWTKPEGTGWRRQLVAEEGAGGYGGSGGGGGTGNAGGGNTRGTHHERRRRRQRAYLGVDEARGHGLAAAARC
jgi:hypothetical protein